MADPRRQDDGGNHDKASKLRIGRGYLALSIACKKESERKTHLGNEQGEEDGIMNSFLGRETTTLVR